MNQFVYYYFLGRRLGMRPKVSAKWVIEWVHWWRIDDNVRGYCPATPCP